MADAIFAGLRLLKDMYKAVQEIKKKLKLSVLEIQRCQTMMNFLVESSGRITKHVRKSGDAAAAKSFASVLEETGQVIRRVTPLLRKKAKTVTLLDTVVKKVSRGFGSVHKQIWVARMSLKGATRLLEKGLECHAKAIVRTQEGGLAALNADLKSERAAERAGSKVASAAGSKGAEAVRSKSQVLAARLSPAAQKVAAGLELMKKLSGMLKVGGAESDGERLGKAIHTNDDDDENDDGAAAGRPNADAISSLMSERNLMKLVQMVFRKQLGLLSTDIDESAFVKLLGHENEETARLLFADMVCRVPLPPPQPRRSSAHAAREGQGCHSTRQPLRLRSRPPFP